MDHRIRELHGRMGRVFHQPVSVTSFTNKRVTVNYRVPLDQVQALLPPGLEADEIGSTGSGMVSMCACDFWVTRIGPLPVPRIRNNEMLCRISARLRKRGRAYRTYYTLRSDASSRFLGFLGSRFSHFRKAVSDFERQDDGDTYRLQCRATDPLCGGELAVRLAGNRAAPPRSSIFADISSATDFVLNLDGSSGYHFPTGRLSFQRIEYPEWDTSFCHELEFDFPLLDHLIEVFAADAVFDCAIYMENVPQRWGRSWLYRPDGSAGRPAERRTRPELGQVGPA